MNKINYEQFNECVYQETLSNGLKVIINPKPDFNSTYASLSVDFGSINTVISKTMIIGKIMSTILLKPLESGQSVSIGALAGPNQKRYR